jgi:hypothetical protein
MTHTKHDMPYIEDPAVYKAVMFARHMMRENHTPPGVANTRAAEYYEVPTSEVAHYVGLAASSVRNRAAKKRARLASPR